MKVFFNTWPHWDLKEENKPESEKDPESGESARNDFHWSFYDYSVPGLITNVPVSVLRAPSHALSIHLSSEALAGSHPQGILMQNQGFHQVLSQLQ